MNCFLGFNYWDDKINSLANRVLIYRIEHSLTITELSEQIGVSNGIIERVEKSKILVSQKMIKRIEEYII
ncbi:helix-turn-helix domain-containing protein [Flavivirga eckloniae]|uniref:helix-turn-helix domain-containing protein n=1 Tax=Flavivirga eckloniae TaxID=1803846 RepID=UPI0013150C6C